MSITKSLARSLGDVCTCACVCDREEGGTCVYVQLCACVRDRGEGGGGGYLEEKSGLLLPTSDKFWNITLYSV